MPLLYDTLRMQLDAVAALIGDLLANPKPDYSIGGKSVSWGTYLGQLLQSQKDLMDELQKANLLDQGGWEIRSYGM